MPPADPVPPHAGDRIAKLLARAGIASRREVERMIAEGRVALDGVALDTPATVLTSLTGITVDGKPVAAPTATRLFIYHKPPGLLVTERDPAGRTTIYDRLPPELPRVVPVGRLDLATEGLLLLTTDGGLKRQLELPATGVERSYRARAYGPISQERLEELIEGIEIDGIRYGPIDANLERRTGANTWIELTLTEGKNREVRRVLEHLGLEVSRLIRTRYGPFVLGDMAPGDVGEVRQHDLEGFRKTLKVGGKAASAAEPVMAEPLTKPAPPAAAASARRAPRPVQRDGSERSAATVAHAQRSASPQDDRPTAGSRRRDDRSPSPDPRGAPTRAAAGRDERSKRAGMRPGNSGAAGAGERDGRPRAFGDRTRAASAARAALPASGNRDQARRGPVSGRGRADTGNDRPGAARDGTRDRYRAGDRDGASDGASAGARNAASAGAQAGDRSGVDRKTPRDDRTPRPPRADASSRRPGTSRPAGARPGDDRPSRGPAGGRGKPQDPRRPKSPPRGKR